MDPAYLNQFIKFLLNVQNRNVSDQRVAAAWKARSQARRDTLNSPPEGEELALPCESSSCAATAGDGAGEGTAETPARLLPPRAQPGEKRPQRSGRGAQQRARSRGTGAATATAPAPLPRGRPAAGRARAAAAPRRAGGPDRPAPEPGTEKSPWAGPGRAARCPYLWSSPPLASDSTWSPAP